MVGDLPLLMRRSTTWQKIGNYLRENGLTGSGLPVEGAPDMIERPEDFRSLR